MATHRTRHERRDNVLRDIDAALNRAELRRETAAMREANDWLACAKEDLRCGWINAVIGDLRAAREALS